MIELVAGILIGGLAVTTIWIMDLKHLVRKKQEVHDKLMTEFGKLTIANNNLAVKETLAGIVENGLTGELSAVEIARSRT